MAITKKIKHKLIDIAVKLVPDGDLITVVLRDVDLPFETIDLDSGAIILKWTRVIELADSHNQVESLLNELEIRFNKNDDLKSLRKDFDSQALEKTLEYLKEIIATNQCILFLGPEVLLTRQGNELIPFYKHLANEFITELDRLQIFYDKEQKQNLSYLIDRYETKEKFVLGQTERFAKKIYDNCSFDDSLFRLISRLNFPLIINANYDTQLRDLFPEKYLSSFYDLSELIHPPFPVNGWPKEKCFIYNVYGSFENEYSIVLNEKDSVDYTRKVYEKNPSIPQLINKKVKQCYGFFVGFHFTEWHLKILFDVLDLAEKPDNFSFLDLSSSVPENQKEYFERQFDMTFIKNSVDTFFKQLQ